MLESDLDFAAVYGNEGGLAKIRAEFEGFFAHDPHGCLVAEPPPTAGICVATPYGRAGFIGELIVAPEWRGHGIGRHLMEGAIRHLHARGVQTVFLDGVPLAVPLYERLGFRKVAPLIALLGTMTDQPHRDVRPMKAADLPAVLELDSRSVRRRP